MWYINFNYIKIYLSDNENLGQITMIWLDFKKLNGYIHSTVSVTICRCPRTWAATHYGPPCLLRPVQPSQHILNARNEPPQPFCWMQTLPCSTPLSPTFPEAIHEPSARRSWCRFRFLNFTVQSSLGILCVANLPLVGDVPDL